MLDKEREFHLHTLEDIMKRIILWPALLMALAWQCWAIEISVDTLLTSSSPYDATAHLTIKNTNTVDVQVVTLHSMQSNRIPRRCS
jgi:hypothetical protein